MRILQLLYLDREIPLNNFFQSQICNDSGNLDTSGTFGDLNQPLGVALAVRRQGWDITNVDASSSLVNNQTSATVRFVTNGDGYAAAGFGVQIDATGPIINPVKSVNRTVSGDRGYSYLYDYGSKYRNRKCRKRCIT